MLEYHLLHLALCGYILSTATKRLLTGWYARVLYAIDTGQCVYLARLYIEFLAKPTRHTSHTDHLKGTQVIHYLCEVALILAEPRNILLVELETFEESAANRLTTQFETRRRGKEKVRERRKMTMMKRTSQGHLQRWRCWEIITKGQKKQIETL